MFKFFYKISILIFILTIPAISNINFGFKKKSHFIHLLKKQNLNNILDFFINTPYKGNMLIGNENRKEKLVINFSGLDCFTYIDYIESIKGSKTINNFIKSLKRIRYKNANITYRNRNHFFTDWIFYNNFKDMVKEISGGNYNVRVKYLNRKKNKQERYLKKIPIIKREINYIPIKNITKSVLKKLKTGDYIGIYTDIAGLDVTHVGIIIKKNNSVYFRHASSLKKNRKIITNKFTNYMKNKKGFIVIRKL